MHDITSTYLTNLLQLIQSNEVTANQLTTLTRNLLHFLNYWIKIICICHLLLS